MLATILRLAAAGTDISSHVSTLYMLARTCSSLSIPIVELGVRDGYSTLPMLIACLETCGKLVSYDIDQSCRNTRFFSNPPRDDELKSRWEFRCKDSVAAASDWPGPHPEERAVGMLFIDTDHTYDQTRAELEAWLPKIRDDAVICGHDYLMESGGVKRAVDEFASENSARFELIVLPNDWGLFVLIPRKNVH